MVATVESDLYRLTHSFYTKPSEVEILWLPPFTAEKYESKRVCNEIVQYDSFTEYPVSADFTG